jgi:multidrug efflux pump subunit AcrB
MTTDEKGIIAWFAGNHVAANLLMMMIIVLGIYSAFTIKKELTPKFESNIITVAMAYPGAAPGEVEQGIILKIEEAIKDLEEIKRIESRASESLGVLTIEIHESTDISEVMDEVKMAIDGINSFPEQAEKPTIQKFDHSNQAIQLQIYGNINEYSAKALSEQIRRELLADPGIAKVEIWGARDYEITVEIDEITLRKYGLTLNQVAGAIRRASIDLPGGSIRTENGDIMLRTKGQAYRQQDFERVVLFSFADGTRLTLGDIATINDGFVEVDAYALFDGTYSIGLGISAVGNQSIIDVAERVKKYVEQKRQELPEGVYLTDWADATYYLQGRLTMMLKNLGMGALLVFIILGLFMELKIAFWVMMGLPICFLGTFILLPLDPFNVSINMISLFGFILVLGIVVDDAIIIGESVHSQSKRYGLSLDSVVKGVKRVAVPATFGVLTTICAFLPTLFIPGVWHNFPAACGYVVLFCLIFSLIESKWILPAHLAHMETGLFRWVKSDWQDRLQERCNKRLYTFVNRHYQPFISKAIANRYTTLACFMAALIITVGLVAGDRARYVMVPDSPNDFVQANLEMVRGTSDSQTRLAMEKMTEAIYRIEERYKQEQGDSSGFIKHLFSYGRDGLIGFFMLEMTKQEDRSINSYDIVKLWREEVGDIPGAKVLSYSAANDDGGADIAFNITGPDADQLEAAAAELTKKLRSYAGVYDIRNGASEKVNEIHLQIKPGAEALGISLADLGHQVREAFYGAEAQRIQRNKDEVKVMVRYPMSDRRSIADLQRMYIRTREGQEVPISAVAELELRPGLATATRINGQQAVQISARADKMRIEPRQVVKELREQFFPKLFERYPDISFQLDGSSLENEKLESSLLLGFALSLFGIYALLAVPLRSYLQPFIIMSAIPYGVIGAVIGHMVMDMAISMMSIFGIIALSGVVVNDSLIMVDFVNRAKLQGESVIEAVIGAGSQRFRAILLTSLTTFFGILPMLLESSVQAQFVIPMAVSLGFGIIFATVITLILVPCLYVMLDDLDRLFQGASDSENTIHIKVATTMDAVD